MDAVNIIIVDALSNLCFDGVAIDIGDIAMKEVKIHKNLYFLSSENKKATPRCCRVIKIKK